MTRKSKAGPAIKKVTRTELKERVHDAYCRYIASRTAKYVAWVQLGAKAHDFAQFDQSQFKAWAAEAKRAGFAETAADDALLAMAALARWRKMLLTMKG